MTPYEQAAGELYVACQACELMRSAQRRYFRTRDANDLRISKDAEKRADRLLAAALSKARGELTQGGLLP